MTAAAACTIVNDFEYVPCPSALVPVTVTFPVRSVAAVLALKFTTIVFETSLRLTVAPSSAPVTVAVSPVRFLEEKSCVTLVVVAGTLNVSCRKLMDGSSSDDAPAACMTVHVATT